MNEHDPRHSDPRAVGSARASVQSRLDAGDLYSRVGDHAQALSTYLAIWHRSPEELVLGLARRVAYCQSQLGRTSEVIAMLDPILSEQPEPELLPAEDREEIGRCLNELGNAYFVEGRLEEAQATGLRSLRYLPADRSSERGVAENILGVVALRSGDIDLARTHFRRALEQFRTIGDVTNLAFAYNNLGHVHKAGCEWERALEHYQAAYYLQATEGAYQDQGAFLQNLAIALMKVGRYEEARDHLDRALARAVELGNPARAFRARLAAVRWARETGDLAGARRQLEELRREKTSTVERRERFFLRLHEAILDVRENRGQSVRDRLEGLREEASAVASRGDLAVEVHLLQAEIALRDRAWDEAEEVISTAIAISHEDRDREQENRARTMEMRWLFAVGRVPEAEAILEEQLHRAAAHGERPREATLHELRAEAAIGCGDFETAFARYEAAKEIWLRIGVHRRADRNEFGSVRCLIETGRVTEAVVRFESLRDRLADADSVRRAGLDELAVSLESVLSKEPDGGIDAELVLRRFEEIFGWDAQPSEMLRATVLLLAEALRAQGAWVGRASESGQIEILTSVSMGRLGGKRILEPGALGSPDARSAGAFEIEVGPERFGALVVPFQLQAQPHLLYLERREGERRRFTRSEVDYATVLASFVARRLPREPMAEATETVSEMEKLRHGIYVADIITQDSEMLSILSLVRRVADSDLTVLLQGETGTGKKLVAQAIHRISPRRDRPFVTVDCAALPDSLLESELFGHRKGAFTGAMQDRVGLLEEANGGTIFLDEIDKAGLAVQRRFLHMLDSGEVRPVGDTGYRPLDVRVVCATSCTDLRSRVEDGRFIKDLYYRLNDIAIQIPALRDRPDDVVLLTDCFLDRFCQELGRELRGISPSFYDAIRAHDWPGNVRELEKAIRRAVTLAGDGEVLSAGSLPPQVLESETPGPGGGSLKDQLDSVERGILLQALRRHRWNKSRAAAELGLSRKGLKGKLERFDLDRRRPRS